MNQYKRILRNVDTGLVHDRESTSEYRPIRPVLNVHLCSPSAYVTVAAIEKLTLQLQVGIDIFEFFSVVTTYRNEC